MLNCARAGRMVAVLCSVSLVSGESVPASAKGEATSGAPPQQAAGQPEQHAAKLAPEQLDSLVSPIALYPDPLLAQVLAASTYPLEIVELQQWLGQHSDLKDEALVEAVKKEDWDPSVQALAALPDAVKLLASNVKWTTELGNAFLAQESDVMDAVQRMRKKAKDNGALKSDDKMKVETQKVENDTVIVVQQANPQVVYVPTYNPVVVYGPAPYPYPPPPPGYVAGVAMLSFGIGVAMGAAFHGGWGYSCGWGGHHSTYVNVNRNNTFVRNTNVAASGRWEHNSRHRGGAPYGDRATADRFGGRTAGDASRGREADRGRDQGRDSRRQSASDTRGGGRRESADANRVGNRSAAPESGRAAGGGAFGEGPRDSTSGSSARSSSERGRSSAGSRSGGGGSRGGSRGSRGGSRGGGRGGRR